MIRRRRDDEPADVRSTAREITDDSDRLPPRRSQAEILEVPEGTTVPHASRFNVLTMGLMALAALLVVGSFVVAGESTKDTVRALDLTWSDWQPTSKGPDQGAREIADHVGREYRLASGEQIVALTGGPMEIGGLPVNIALRQSAADGGDIDLVPGNGVLYRMCGLGRDCSIDRGTPSAARLLLLRREALELALYSFRYLKKDDVETVVVFLPPPPKKKGDTAATDEAAATETGNPTSALYFRRELLTKQIRDPLANTLPAPVPQPATVRRSKGSTFVDQITNQLLFQASVTQANQESSVFLVLDPLRTTPVILGGRTGGQGSTPAAPVPSTGGGGNGTISGSLSTPLSPTVPGATAKPQRGASK